MKTINQSAKRQVKSSHIIIIFILVLIIAIVTYLSVKTTPPKKTNKGFSSLYSGNSKSDGSEQPAKLRWSDSFKGIDNTGNK